MIVPGTIDKYADYIKTVNSRWEFANNILYDMCRFNPKHDDENIIVGKIWLIGRSYAAAIERRKNAQKGNDDFYYDVVAPKMLEKGKELDNRLKRIRNNKGSIKDNLAEILGAHKFLLDIFYELTKLEKRSLASKYLHFHCPDKFFIYDSRARAAIFKIVKRPDKQVHYGINYKDEEYADFVCRMLEFQQEIHENFNGKYESPRDLDNYLLKSFGNISL